MLEIFNISKISENSFKENHLIKEINFEEDQALISIEIKKWYMSVDIILI